MLRTRRSGNPRTCRLKLQVAQSNGNHACSHGA